MMMRPYLRQGWVSSAARRFFSTDPIFQLAASNLRFGKGATAEVGLDLAEQFRVKSAVVFTDPTIERLDCFQVLLKSLESSNVQYKVYNSIRVEPTDVSFQAAADYLTLSSYDAVVAMGGGSVLDTAKAANLYACHPVNDFYEYVNPPIGHGTPIPGTLKPLIAVPTTAGTGSETTGVAIFDDTPTNSKTGIAHRHLKPTLGVVDVVNTETLPEEVAIHSGLDVLCHAAESYTALPSSKRSPHPSSPLLRPAYQGSNPIADVWSLYSLEVVANNLKRAVTNGDEEARSQMLLAASAAGVGFGNAGVHVVHGMSYPVSSQNKSFFGYTDDLVDHPLIPHGYSVVVNAPAVFSWTGVADPDRHNTVARILQTARLGTSTADAYQDAGAFLADEIRHLCASLNVQLGLRNLGYSEANVPELAKATEQQHRVTKISPRPVTLKDLEQLFLSALDE